MEEINIDQFLNQFSPYFLSLRSVDNYNIVDIQVPNLWDVGKVSEDLTEGETKLQAVVTGQEKTSKIISIVGIQDIHSFGMIFKRVGVIVKVNLEREQKNILFKDTVKKLEKLFIDTDLDQLQNIKIDVPEEINENIEVGNAENINLPSNIEKQTTQVIKEDNEPNSK